MMFDEWISGFDPPVDFLAREQLRVAWCAGMSRAAEICMEQVRAAEHHRAIPMTFLAVQRQCAEAIRAEAEGVA